MSLVKRHVLLIYSIGTLWLNTKINSRLHYTYLNWDKMDQEKKKAILSKAATVLANIDKGFV
jgi:hypothetical protein